MSNEKLNQKVEQIEKEVFATKASNPDMEHIIKIAYLTGRSDQAEEQMMELLDKLKGEPAHA